MSNTKSLAKSLANLNLIPRDKIDTYIEDAGRENLLSHLIKKGLVTAHDYALAVSEKFSYPYLNLSAVDFSLIEKDLMSIDLIEKHQVIPLSKSGSLLHVAMSDPNDFNALDDIKFNTHCRVNVIVVEHDKLAKEIEVIVRSKESTLSDMVGDDDLDLDIEIGHEEVEEDTSSGDETPVVRFVNKILLDAINEGTSDIHLEMYEKNFRVRYRHDGILREVVSPPKSMATRIISRIKVMSNMDIAERRLPQDGRIVMKVSKTRAIDFRVNTCPTLHGEKVVLRILDPSNAKMGIEALGFSELQRKNFTEAINKPYGMVLVTGPTGSGKTVTLYTGLNMLNTAETNISTAEDPVEITVDGINQVNVNVKTGMTFGVALKAFLRQDPDVIMVGEIRDLDTAEIAVKAAQTGHMVLSTLHTNDAPQTIARLAQMGVATFNIASAVSLIMAQRLARRLCKHCKKESDVPDEALLEMGFVQQELKDLTIYEPVGCEHCVKGYKGRVGIYQVLPITDSMGRLIMAGATADKLADQARDEGIDDLRASGLHKIREGITGIEEINRVTNAD